MAARPGVLAWPGLNHLHVPALYFILALCVWIGASLATGHGVPHYDKEANRNGTQYVAIAANGYEIYPCTDGKDMNRENLYPRCGNAGWFPGYPLLIKVFTLGGIPPRLAGTLVSHIFFLGVLVLIGQWASGALGREKSLWALALAMVFPGSVYYQANAPMSMFLFYMILAFRLSHHSKWKLSGVSAFVAGFTHPVGLLLAPIMGGLAAKESGGSNRLAKILYGALPPLGGTLGALMVIGISSGVWNGFFRAQSLFRTQIFNPFHSLGSLWNSLFKKGLDGILYYSSLQTLLVGVLIALCFWYCSTRKPGNDPMLDFSVLAWSGLVWILGLAVCDKWEMCATEAFLLPLVFIVCRFRVRLLAPLIGLLFLLKFKMVDGLYSGVLI